LIEGGRTTYDAAARELVLEIDIPDADVVPRERAWKYVAARTAVVPVPLTTQRSMRSMPVSLRAALDACFGSIEPRTVEVASVNGQCKPSIPRRAGRTIHA
jgi:hypothetical protein